MTIKEFLKKNVIIRKTADLMKEISRTKGKYKFTDRRKRYNKMCMVLAGYKEYLWDIVFDRLAAYVEPDIDVCIISSGLYSSKLDEICQRNDWSYLSTKKNKLDLAQNITIMLHPEAELIYKLDEDIFLTKNYFENMENVYKKVLNEDKYEVGYVAALMNLHHYASIAVLNKMGHLEEAEKKFGKLKYGITKSVFYDSSEFAKYMWGDKFEEMRDLDKVAEEFERDGIQYSFSPFAYGIGAMLMPRRVWEEMGKFPVRFGVLMSDEGAITNYCCMQKKVIVIAENVLVGHFCYYLQNEEMKKYFAENKDLFYRSLKGK